LVEGIKQDYTRLQLSPAERAMTPGDARLAAHDFDVECAPSGKRIWI
jgi:hypothetical protein